MSAFDPKRTFRLDTMVKILAAVAVLSSGLSVPAMAGSIPPHEARVVAEKSVLANTARILGIPESRVLLDASFSNQEPPADELDVVEIIMAVEDELGVVIDDSELERVSGARDPNGLASHLSVRKLQEVVGSLTLPRHPAIPTPPPAKHPTDPLGIGESGAYRQLVARPNPDGHVIVTVPDADELIEALARERSRPLTAEEIAEIRSTAPSLVMSREDADELRRARAARRTK